MSSALAAWAHQLEPVVPLPVPPAPGLGVAVAVVGLALLATGIADLIRRGLGLPMNAFPPRLFVRTGVYRWIRNPIYVGFGLAVAGVSLATLLTLFVVPAFYKLLAGFTRSPEALTREIEELDKATPVA